MSDESAFFRPGGYDVSSKTELEVVATFDGLYLIPRVMLEGGTELCRLADAKRLQAERDAQRAEIEKLNAELGVRDRAIEQYKQSVDGMRSMCAALHDAARVAGMTPGEDVTRLPIRVGHLVQCERLIDLNGIGEVQAERDTLRAEVERLRQQVGASSTLVAAQWPSELPEGITIDKDFFGTVHIKTGDFDFIQIQYDHRYTYNSHQEWVANRIVQAVFAAPAEKQATPEAGSLPEGPYARLRHKLSSQLEPGSSDQD